MKLKGYDIVLDIFIGTDGKEYTRGQLAQLGIWNPADAMIHWRDRHKRKKNGQNQGN